MEKKQLDTILLGYTLSRKIGVNSLFNVYEGYSRFGEKVIFKIAHDRYMLREILINEYRNLKLLEGIENIPLALELIENQILILKYIEGENVKILRKEKRLNWEEIRNIFLELLELIVNIHKKGIVHGDIKVENLIYDRERLKLIDFGASQLVGEKRAIVQYTPSMEVNEGYSLHIKDKKYDYYCLFRVFLYLIRGDKKIEFEKLPNNLENFIRAGLEGKLSDGEEILDLWDFLRI